MAAAGGRCSASSIDCLAGGIGWVGEVGVVGTVVREPELAMAIDSAGAGGGASGGFFSGVKEAASNGGGGKEVRAGGVADCLGCCCCCLPRPGWEEGGYNDLNQKTSYLYGYGSLCFWPDPSMRLMVVVSCPPLT